MNTRDANPPIVANIKNDPYLSGGVVSFARAARTREPRDTSARVDGKVVFRGRERMRIQGVTYGPFAASAAGEPFPARERVKCDFALMTAAEINAIRTYHPPPEWMLELADEQDLMIFMDAPWPNHLCFLDGKRHRASARRQVKLAARLGRRHTSVLAYNIGNEIAPDIVRWHGAREVERFLADLYNVAKDADPDGLVTYANFPPTEYLDLTFLDFATFNIYLHDPATFRRYLLRLQNLVGDRPLMLGELGMDTLRHGEISQADFLNSHMREVYLLGLAGAFVFSWTDEWHTGGHSVQDWAFGITSADRAPKPAYHALREVFELSTVELLPESPRVSVVVCSYNGGETLKQCLDSLCALDYPDYEIIVVDDGSTDATREILKSFPNVKAIHQSNHGLSAARNVGLRAAAGDIVAYTDSDCFVDANWLTHLVKPLLSTGAAAVGGPNLTTDDGWLAACVAACPGQPTHVLESDQVAEHIPGCNMAFRRHALQAINGFDPQYRKAGDDVDVCWRLQQAGYWITFAPGAFVWHHRRQTPGAYLRQQAGYGEAEALLRFKHPEKFNGFGEGKWRGVLYGASQGLRLDDGIIYRGTFGTGLFQCIYQPATAHWAMMPATFEWQVLTGIAGIIAFLWPMLWLVVVGMLGLTAAVAALQARQARLLKRHQGSKARLLIAVLCFAQPLIRSWARYRTRLFGYRAPVADGNSKARGERLPLLGRVTMDYWSEEGYDRTELLGLLIAQLNERGWGKTVDSGWQDWDVEVFCHPWTVVQVGTVQEEHGNGKRIIRVRYKLRPSGYTCLIAIAAFACIALVAVFQVWSAAIGACLLTCLCASLWWRGTIRAAQARNLVEAVTHQLNMIDVRAKAPTRTLANESIDNLAIKSQATVPIA